MDGMGYRNAKRVYQLARDGEFIRKRGDMPVVYDLARDMMVYMAQSAIDWEDEESKKTSPARCYWGGWDLLMRDLGMVAPLIGYQVMSGDVASAERILETRERTAKNRISTAAKFLQKRGLITRLVSANSFMGRNAVWLLNLGDPAENIEVEAFARMRLGLPSRG